MRVAELKALVREHRLRGYSRLRKAELIALHHPVPQTRPTVPGDPHWGVPHKWRPPRPSRGPWPPTPWMPPPLPPQLIAAKWAEPI